MADDFVDQVRITVAGGNGGNGSVHFRREKFVPMGGPDGGDGGNGGSVILVGDRSLNTLYGFRHKRSFAAPSGQPGGSSRRHGKAGTDLEVPVPVGTLVVDDDSAEMIADISSDRATAVVARGGKGGLGNIHFASSTHQAPGFAEKGEPGQERRLRLDLKLLADVSIVGLPNAGKSTLLASMSSARPKIADHPFTTLSPNLGVVALDDFSFVAADVPGLIEGAHEGRGLGHRFLRHVERSRVLVRLVDASSPDPVADFDLVSAELSAYDPSLLYRPQIAALNKIDLIPRELVDELSRRLSARGLTVVPVSAVTREGLSRLIGAIRTQLEQSGIRPAAPEQEDEVYVFRAREDPDAFSVERKRGTFTVSGRSVERLVTMTDLESAEAVDHLQRRLKRLGVISALEAGGVRAGNKVRIGDVELIWEGELEPGVATPASRTAPRSRRRN